MKFNKEKFNHYGFNHKKVFKHFKHAELTYCNTFCVLDNYHPAAVYYNRNPDREKNHKDYLLLFTRVEFDEPQLVIAGLNTAEIEPYRYQEGLWCQKCDDVIYSVFRHDYRECECKANAIDGGRDYCRVSADPSTAVGVKIDLLTDQITSLDGEYLDAVEVCEYYT